MDFNPWVVSFHQEYQGKDVLSRTKLRILHQEFVFKNQVKMFGIYFISGVFSL